MFVSHSEITVDEGRATVLEAAFRARARRVDTHDGFLGLELLRDVGNGGRYVLVTRWRTRADFRRYVKSEDYRAAHAAQRAGLEEASGGAPLRQFERVDL